MVSGLTNGWSPSITSAASAVGETCVIPARKEVPMPSRYASLTTILTLWSGICCRMASAEKPRTRTISSTWALPTLSRTLSSRVVPPSGRSGLPVPMRVDMQLLPLGGTTLLENVLDNVGKAQVDEIVQVLGFSADAIRQQIPLHNVKIVVNDAYREGMGTSLRAGITQVSPTADAALVMLGDQPFVKPETIDQLIRVYGEQKPQIVIPVYQGFRGNPVLLDRSGFPELLGLD